MRHRRNELCVHLVWSTWDRAPLLTPELLAEVKASLTADSLALECEALAFGGAADHCHVLMRLAPTVAVADLVQQLKGASSHRVNQLRVQPDLFRWQGGYSVTSVSPHDVEQVRTYVLGQAARHADNHDEP